MKLLNMSDIIPNACALIFLEDNKNTFFTFRYFMISSLGTLFFCAVGLLLLN